MNPEPIIAIVAAALLPYLLWSYLEFQAEGHKVTAISDGDGFKYVLEYERKKFKPQKVRIYGIDAPELWMVDGPEAKEALSRLLLGKKVRITFDADSHDRWVCKVKLWPFIDVAAWMVLTGWAWNYVEYGGRYGFLQSWAQFWKLGIWKNGVEGVIYPQTARAEKEKRGKVVSFKASSKQKRKTK